MISQFKYGQTCKIWPSPLSLSLYSTFKSTVGMASVKLRYIMESPGLKSSYEEKGPLRTSALSCLSLTKVDRDVSPAKSFALDFNSFGKSLI